MGKENRRIINILEEENQQMLEHEKKQAEVIRNLRRDKQELKDEAEYLHDVIEQLKMGLRKMEAQSSCTKENREKLEKENEELKEAIVNMFKKLGGIK